MNARTTTKPLREMSHEELADYVLTYLTPEQQDLFIDYARYLARKPLPLERFEELRASVTGCGLEFPDRSPREE